MYLRKQTLDELNLGELSTLAELDFLEAIEKLKLYNHHSWLLPQLVQHFSTWKILADGKSTVLYNCQTPQQRGLYRLTRIVRSALLKAQNKHSEYSQLVPIILLAHKRYNGRSYESWRNYPGLEWILEPELYQAVTAVAPQCSREELLEITTTGLTTLDGKPKNPVSTHKLTGVDKDHKFYNLPRLLIVQLCQIWLAHPTIRHEAMILDHNNWDSIPQPLIDVEVLANKSQPKNKPLEQVPWKLDNSDIGTLAAV